MAWIYIIMAGLLEIMWVIGLKYSHGFTKMIPSIITVIIIIFSFFLLSKALHSIPLGTGYAIFTGLGTVGTVVTFFGSLSFYFLSLSLTSLPVGTAYAIWTGIGSIGSVIAGMMFFHEPRSLRSILLIMCIVTGAVGIKLTSGH